ncbi:MAG: undecaprenyl-phosphate glucose phosphotransferase [Magnetococcales bacterium]|nr:undecaprenyl-phosphate glucose phosphotransferase [Magnetococcales bacterium]MBF0150706.1 undecaprenyl-phosphate glucose phosphotransferase [Magnetococcales bacterium]
MNKNNGLIKRNLRELDLLMRFLDIVVLLTSGLFSLYWSFGSLTHPRETLTIGLFVVLIWLVVANANNNLYRQWRGISLWVEVGTVSWVLVLVIMTVAMVIRDLLIVSRPIPDLLFGKWLAICWLMLVIYRVSLRNFLRWMRRKGYNHRHIVIAGAGDLGRKVIRELAQATWTGLDVVAFFDDCYPNNIPREVEGIPVVGTLDDLHTFVELNDIDQVWIALPLRAEQRMKKMIKSLRHSTVDILFIPDIFTFDLLNHSITQISGIPVMNLSVTPMVGLNRKVKAVEDRVLAFLILLLCMPLMLVIAIQVKKSSPGPILFRQIRHGWDGRKVEVWKFRTMYLHEEPEGQVIQAKRNDSRVTPIGQFLRRTSLDELPQFINVLQGTMSIVGPRPHAVEHNIFYRDEIDQYMKRHIVKPGITGWAQVNGLRGETDTLEKMQRRVEFDLYYISNWSLFFDIRIILMTIIKLFFSRNAY